VNLAATNLSPLADIKVMRTITRKSADALYAMADGGDLVEGSFQWVWNISTNPFGEIRDLRWWVGELMAPNRQANLTLDEVINFIVPQKRREFPSGEVLALLVISRPTLMQLRAELLGDLRAGGSFYPRAGLVQFFRRRWLGQVGTSRCDVRSNPETFPANRQACPRAAARLSADTNKPGDTTHAGQSSVNSTGHIAGRPATTMPRRKSATITAPASLPGADNLSVL